MSNETSKSKRENPSEAKRRSVSKADNGSSYKFIEGYLSEADRQWLADDRDNIYEHICTLYGELVPGYSIKVTFDKKSDRFLATMSCSDSDDGNFAHTLASRGSTPITALHGLYYRHYVKFRDGWRQGTVGSTFDYD